MNLVRTGSLRLLDLDCECLPGHWIGGDYVSKILTAVAWKVIGQVGRPHVLTHYRYTPEEMAAQLAIEVEKADIVVGHYIRGFDLPLLNGALLRGGLAPLGQVFCQDTKLDLKPSHGRSLSQKNLAAMIGVEAPKIDVNLTEWEEFNTRTPGAEKRGIERVRGDVDQNIEMRERLLELGWLGPPRIWKGGADYVP